jgi:hypothetical protein
MGKRNGWSRKRDSEAERARVAEYASPQYRAARRAVKAEVEAGRGSCWRCGRYLPPGSRFHLGHDDHDRTVLRGAECPDCNLSAAARKGARIRNAGQPRGAPRASTGVRL